MSDRTRTRKLPPGWYPVGATELNEAVRELEQERSRFESADSSRAVVVPHAGWAFSGALAYATLCSLAPDLDCIAVVGGHLRPGDPIHVALEDRFETPLGHLQAAETARRRLREALQLVEDREVDNSVEVQLPLVKKLFPQAQLLYLRAPPDEQALRLAEQLAEVARQTNSRLGVVGSTDLTHYGAGFGFTPHGPAAEAVDWVKRENDPSAIEPLLQLDPHAALEAAISNRAACSMGAGACAARYAQLCGSAAGKLVGYYTSFDVIGGDTIVGYAGIAFENPV